jgi:uncharacterized membrane protein
LVISVDSAAIAVFGAAEAATALALTMEATVVLADTAVVTTTFAVVWSD